MLSASSTPKFTILLAAFLFVVLLTVAAQAQAYDVLHNDNQDGAFPVGALTMDRAAKLLGGTDGSVPLGTLVFDQAGNIYGATSAGGNLCDWARFTN